MHYVSRVDRPVIGSNELPGDDLAIRQNEETAGLLQESAVQRALLLSSCQLIPKARRASSGAALFLL
jgi:hypothetical protein